MIEHVYRRAADARAVDAVVVATDDERIAAAVRRFGGIVRMTQSRHRTGTDRIAEVAGDLECDLIVNVQGDLPLVEPDMISQVVTPLLGDRTVCMSTICSPSIRPEELAKPNVVKVVVDRAGDALYFSRSPIPYLVGSPEDPPAAGGQVNSGFSRTVGVGRTLKHVGMYGYRRDFLLEFASLPRTPLEEAEALEQLRALEHGFRIRVVETQYDSIEVDTAEDLERVRSVLAIPAQTRNAAEAVR
jgi:3-deoxy-manno-octulosonate cytidylyltransferase (CMP-KDO synthetase)